MLKKILDAKYTLEGKCIAIIMSAMLAVSMMGIPAFAADGVEADAQDVSAVQQGAVNDSASQNSTPPEAEPLPEVGQNETDEPSAQAPVVPEAPVSPPSNSQPIEPSAPEVDEALITFETENAYVSINNQVLSGKTISVALYEELKFAAAPDGEGQFAIGSVKAKNATTNTEIEVKPIEGEEGAYVIAKDFVDSNLVIEVKAQVIENTAPEKAPADIITSDTVVNPEQDGEIAEDAPAEDLVVVEAETGNPAFEGYAQVGNVTVKVTAAEGALPEGTTVEAAQVDRVDVIDAVAAKAETQDKTLEDALALDVTLLDKDGREIQPNGAVNVSFFNASVAGEEVGVFRVSDDAATVEAIGTRQADAAVQSFDVDHFSIYVVGGMRAVAQKTISFDKNGGRGTVPSNIQTTVGSHVAMPEKGNLSKSGFLFVGWSEDGDASSAGSDHYKSPVYAPGTTYIVPKSGKSEMIKLYAVWAKEDVNGLFFIRKDGTIPDEPSSYPSSQYTSGIAITDTIQVGKFVADTSGVAVVANLNRVPTDQQIKNVLGTYNPDTQYVIWYVMKNEGGQPNDAWNIDGVVLSKDKVNLTYQMNAPVGQVKGSFPLGGQYFKGDKATVADSTSFIREGYTFKNWNTQSDGSGTSYQGGYTLTLTQPETALYAIWVPNNSTNYRVQDYLQNSDETWPETPTQSTTASGTTGASVSAEATKTYVGYTFDKSNSNNVLSGTIKADGSLVLKRYYKVNASTVTYLPGDHGDFEAQSYDALFGAVTPAYSGPLSETGTPLGKFGYNFNGWMPRVSDTVQAETTEYVAQWTSLPVINVLVQSEDKTFTYNGEEHVVSVPSQNLDYQGLPEGFTIENLSASGRGTTVGQYDIAIEGEPVVRNAEGVDVTDKFAIARDRNKLTIEHAPLTITAPTKTKIYDGSPLTFSFEEIVGTDLVQGLIDGQNLVGIDVFGERTDIGSTDSFVQGAVIVAGTENVTSNYEISYVPGKLTVTQNKMTVSAVNVDKTYDGQRYGISATPSVSDATIKYWNESTQQYDLTNSPTFLDWTNGPQTVKFQATYPGYETAEGEATVTINKREVVLTSQSDTKVYDGFALTNHEVVAGSAGFAEGEGASYAFTGTQTLVGFSNNTFDYTLNANTNADNYQISTDQGTLNVTPRDAKYEITLEANSLTAMYDGTEKTVDGFKTLTFTTSDGNTYTVEGASASASGTDVADSAQVNIEGAAVVKDVDGNVVTDQFSITLVPGKLTILPAPLTVQINGNTNVKTYNGVAQYVEGYEVAAVPEGVDINLKPGVEAKAAGTNVDTYTMGLNADSFSVVAPNYNVTLNVADGWLEINPAELVIKANDGGKTYGQPDGELTAKVEGLQGSDTFTGSYDIVREQGDTPGNYQITVGNVVFDNPNYTVRTEPGTFVITPAGTVGIIVTDASKPYDGTPLTPEDSTIVGLQPGDTVEFVYGGSQTEAGSSGSNVSNVIIRDQNGNDVTSNYTGVEVTPGALTVTPKAVIIVVDSAAKVAGTEDPAFTGTVSGLVAEGDLGEIAYSRNNAAVNEVGTYEGVLGAIYTNNKNYAITVVPGSFTITAAPVVPPTPVTPPTPATPTPTPTPAVPDTIPPILVPIVEGLAAAAETVIAPAETPLAEPRETQIEDDVTPLAQHEWCWVHFYIILGIIVTALYAAAVALHRGLFSRKLKAFEDDLTGGSDPAPGAPARTGSENAPSIPQGAPLTAAVSTSE